MIPMAKTRTIVVVGSLNMDFVVQTERLPYAGETVLGSGVQTLAGGKGANQACAAGKLGGRTRLIGRVGDDTFGPQLISDLDKVGVDTSDVLLTSGIATGAAFIAVDSNGQNQIVVASGANAALSEEDINRRLASTESDGCLLLQLESPLETVSAAARLAALQGMTVVLDPAPAQELSAEILKMVDILTPNETEALHILGRVGACVTLEMASEIGQALLNLGPPNVVLKLGAQGVWLQNQEGGQHFPAPVVTARDATAAGDTFNGALAVALTAGSSLPHAICFANYAAAFSVTRVGAQRSTPQPSDVETLIRNQPLGEISDMANAVLDILTSHASP